MSKRKETSIFYTVIFIDSKFQAFAVNLRKKNLINKTHESHFS